MVWPTVARHLLTPRPAAREADPATVAALAERLNNSGVKKLGRSLAIRHVPAGSCNGCELELRATQNLIHDLTRYGLSFTPSPRHADVLLITGVAARNMLDAVRQAREAMPDPVFVIAVGDCALDGGVFKSSPAITGGADSILPADLAIPGCPPTPGQIIEGLLALIEAHAGPRHGRKDASVHRRQHAP
jgi:Ni,Fe-hydrogenase III small subunit